MDLWAIYVLSLITVCVIWYYETHWCDLLTMDKVAMSVYLPFQTHRQTMSRVACVHVVDHIDSPAVAFPMNSLSRTYGRIESLYPPALPFQSNASPLSTAFTGGSNQRVMPDLSSVLAMRMNTRACVRAFEWSPRTRVADKQLLHQYGLWHVSVQVGRTAPIRIVVPGPNLRNSRDRRRAQSSIEEDPAGQ